ncbi:MAG TPA: ATPase domain-containing protein [Geminicoccaceae bacterium]|nr:ATPase domain-containing protein [Geminicoccaceae bacterium]
MGNERQGVSDGQSERHELVERLPTGIEGLDLILGGGLFAGGLYMVQGPPGSGKTILTNQLCFHLAGQGRRVAYLTLMAEAHDRMLRHLQSLAFTNLSLLPDPLYYASAYAILEEEGLDGLLALIRETLRKGPGHARITPGDGLALLVLDGLYVAHERAQSERAFRRFVYELQGEAALRNVTFLFVTGAPSSASTPELTMVDGLIALEDRLVGARAVRTLQVTKFRGAGYLRGRHLFRIKDEGILVHPRLETLVAGGPDEKPIEEELSTGIAELDRMLRGGLPAFSTTLVVGPTGSGKTTFGLLFLAAATAEAPGLFFGCYESEGELRLKAHAIGIEVDRRIEEGALHILWHPSFETSLDEMGDRLCRAVERHGIRRLFVDGLGAFRRAPAEPGRLGPFFTALSIRLQAMGVTVACSLETENALSPHRMGLDELSALSENILLLRLGEQRARLVRMLSIVKVRQSGFDPAVVCFEITDHGVVLGEAPENAALPPAGAARPPAPDDHR